VATDEAMVQRVRRTRWRHARGWVRRYLPAEIVGLISAVAGALVAFRLTGSGSTAAFAGTAGEAVGYYATIAVSDLRRHRRAAGASRWQAVVRTSRDVAIEFGPAEIVDSLVVRPGLMFAGPIVTGSLVAGTLLGKVAADIVFYAFAISGYEVRTRIFADPDPEGAPTMPAARTPYLLLDLDAVTRAYDRLAGVFPGVALHYAVKCNSDPRLLRRLRDLGCRFEIASAAELAVLRRLRVEPRDLLFSNPVKVGEHVRAAHTLGVYRFAVDSAGELDKIATNAPGAAVYVRLGTAGGGQVPSEGKFGVDVPAARGLLRGAASRGLIPYGLTFHVGSQTTDPTAWDAAIEHSAQVMSDLLEDGIRLHMLDIGGGFPAAYVAYTPQPADFAKHIRAALDRYLPYPVELVAEPGRALVAEAGTMVTTVIGIAERFGRRWVHLDVGAFNGMMEALETGNRLLYPVSDSRQSATLTPYHLTGPSCDSQDTVLHDAPLSDTIAIGDTVYIHSAGAYTTGYASRFNGFDVPATVIA
jgi:ornithine decarboxylase